MRDTPLQPFAPPAIFSHLPAGFSSGTIIVAILSIVFAFWLVYTLVITYHWIRYSHASLVALPSIGVHLFVSALLMGYVLTGVLRI